MQLIHRISISSSPEIRAELARIGIVADANGLVSFELDESHESWPMLQRWIADRKPIDIIVTKFSKQELTHASWLELVPDWHYGYPQPNEDVFGYRGVTYNLSDYCLQCGTGLKQKAPFQMKAEPKWGRNGIFQLNWVFDEYFVTPEVWANIFESHGINCRPVLNTKGAELKSVVQLVISEEVDIDTDGLLQEKCTTCGRVKYLPITRGKFPPLMSKPIGHIVKTKQYFGSGASANKRVLISQDITQALLAENVRGASMRPVMDDCQ